MDDNVAVIGDWVPPSLTPRTFFSAMLYDDIGTKPQENHESNRLSASDGMNLAAVGHMETRPGYTGCDHSTEGSLSTEPRSNYRGGLGQRIAARAGFNAPRLNTEGMRSAELSANPEVRSPYLMISPGLSPTILLDSPIFLSNSLVQPSPTTGKFPFFPNNIDSGSGLVSNASDKSQFEGSGTSSFASKPLVDSGGYSLLGSGGKVNSFPRVDARVHSESSFQLHDGEQSKVQPQNDSAYHGLSEYSRQPIVDGPDCSLPLNDQVEDEGDLKGSLGDTVVGVGGEPANDGYNWRKYGQKLVKGSKYPRSYYKCTHASCQVKKKVERSYEGHITEIIYKGVHKHSKPLQDRRSVIAGPDGLGEVPGDDGDPAWAIRKAETAEAGDWRPENNHDVMSSPSDGLEVIGNPAPSLPAQNRTHFGSADHADGSSTFSNDEGEDDRQTHVSASMGNDGEGDEFESKRRKIEAYASDVCGATRAIREPRVVVQTTSEVDILDDGYRWRKYGQKVVKGNPNPRSYYKCTSAGCSVRKHVERASHDLKSVITTYEGKHNHDVPAARNSSHADSGTNPAHSNPSGIQNQVHRPEPSQLHNMMARLDGPPSLCPFNLPARATLGLGPSQGYSFRTSQNGGLQNIGMAGLGPGQRKLPMIPVLPPLLMQQHQACEMGMMLPKGEANVEPGIGAGLNFSSGSAAVYQQMMGRLPLDHKM